MSLSRYRPPLTNLDLTFTETCFFPLKSPSFLPNITKLGLVCNIGIGLNKLGLMIYITIIDHRYFCFAETYKISN